MRCPGAAPHARSVPSAMRAKRNSLSRVEPVGITSRMSRSRSTTRIRPTVAGSGRAPGAAVSSAGTMAQAPPAIRGVLDRIGPFRAVYVGIVAYVVVVVATLQAAQVL